MIRLAPFFLFSLSPGANNTSPPEIVRPPDYQVERANLLLTAVRSLTDSLSCHAQNMSHASPLSRRRRGLSLGSASSQKRLVRRRRLRASSTEERSSEASGQRTDDKLRRCYAIKRLADFCSLLSHQANDDGGPPSGSSSTRDRFRCT